ncbi:MAG TPA: crosslink repair DNA glycosylase YcaQ family protein [Ktedonobacteraceae bacterium]|nr:crosslink repair DNA glycosylase YcaQ family protein [Ktedonobacteraceae bacterium]
MTLHISREQARHLLAHYHFTPTDLPGVFERLGTVQYDPLNPVGRNPDLVLQARVPGYQVDDWQQSAYTDRIIYDAWDKMACLVPISDWPMRAIIRQKLRPYHDREILQNDPEGMDFVLATIDKKGPLSSLEFEDRTRVGEGSWYGDTRVKRLLRSLWACGLLVTHHRKAGRHYYDRPERVIPARYFELEPLIDEEAYYRWIVMKRFQASGIMRLGGEASIWVACGDALQRKAALAHLVESGLLTPLYIGDLKNLYYMPTTALDLLDKAPLPPRMIFLGPLDSILWDRKTIQHLFDFDYIWEVYKPAEQRKWGYYILPVFYGDRFVARAEMRLEQGTLVIARWWWEHDITPDVGILDALRSALEAFAKYAHATTIVAQDEVDCVVRNSISA